MKKEFLDYLCELKGVVKKKIDRLFKRKEKKYKSGDSLEAPIWDKTSEAEKNTFVD